MRKATRIELDESLFFVIPIQVSDRIIELYSASRNFDQANSFASTVIRYANDYSKEQVQRVIKACGENDQIEYSIEIGSVINALRKNGNVNDDQVNEWLVEVDLEKFVKIKNDEKS